MTNSDTASSERLQSLDIFRGLTMFLLVCETAGVWSALRGLSFDNPVWHKVVTHLTHHEWNGLHFWDLVQPFFMFIVGVAMAFFHGQTNGARQHVGPVPPSHRLSLFHAVDVRRGDCTAFTRGGCAGNSGMCSLNCP